MNIADVINAVSLNAGWIIFTLSSLYNVCGDNPLINLICFSTSILLATFIRYGKPNTEPVSSDAVKLPEFS